MVRTFADKFLGKGWRLPTYEEVEELLSNRFQPTISKDTFGLRVYGRDGNGIFLPAANIGVGSSNGQYWSSSLDDDDPSQASQFRFDRRGVYGGCNKKDYKQAIRSVFDKRLL